MKPEIQWLVERDVFISTANLAPLVPYKLPIRHCLHTVSVEMLFKSGCCPLTVGRQNLPDPSAIRSSLWDSRLTAVSTSCMELGVVWDSRLSTDSTSSIRLCVVLFGWSFKVLERNANTYESVPITAKVVSSYPVHEEVYKIQHYVIKFVSNLRQGGGFLRVLRFPQPIKLTATI